MTQVEILLHYRLPPADVIIWSETHSPSSNRLVPQNMDSSQECGLVRELSSIQGVGRPSLGFPGSAVCRQGKQVPHAAS